MITEATLPDGAEEEGKTDRCRQCGAELLSTDTGALACSRHWDHYIPGSQLPGTVFTSIGRIVPSQTLPKYRPDDIDKAWVRWYRKYKNNWDVCQALDEDGLPLTTARWRGTHNGNGHAKTPSKASQRTVLEAVRFTVPAGKIVTWLADAATAKQLEAVLGKIQRERLDTPPTRT